MDNLTRSGTPVVRSSILKYFEYHHLSPRLREISKPFYELATRIEETLAPGPEKSVALRKLLEGKDAAVRAGLEAPESTHTEDPT